jgi:hypothetical protein
MSDPSNPVVELASTSKILRHVFHYVRSGAVRIDAVSDDTGFQPLAFVNKDGQPVVVVRNQGGAPFAVQGLPPGTYGIAYSGSTGADHAARPDVTIQAGESITTNGAGVGAVTIYRRGSTGPLCAAAPLPEASCYEGGAAAFSLRRRVGAERNELKWTWSKGAAFEQAGLGHPDLFTDYMLCIYDYVDAKPSLSSGLSVLAGGSWRDRSPRGYSYKDREGAQSGVRNIVLKTGGTSRGKVRIDARGVKLPMPVPHSASETFDQDPANVVQLVAANGSCWSTRFTPAETSRNDADRFRARKP